MTKTHDQVRTTLAGPELTQRGSKAHHIARDTPVTIVATFDTLDGQPRYVVSFDAVPGLLHIESPARLRIEP